MSTGISKHLGARPVATLQKLGDRMIPGDSDLPSFSASGCVKAVDRILDFMPERDLGDLKTLLLVLSFFPGFMIGWLLALLERSPSVPGPLGPVLRMIRLGLRGLVMSLYYGDAGVLKRIGYEVSVYRGDL